MSDDDKPKDDALAETSAEIVLKLAKPIMAHGEKLTELRLKPPTALDYMQIGNPVVLDMNCDPPRISHDTKIVVPMLAKLAAIPPSSVKSMDVQDLADAAWAMTGFFMPASMMGRTPP